MIAGFSDIYCHYRLQCKCFFSFIENSTSLFIIVRKITIFFFFFLNMKPTLFVILLFYSFCGYNAETLNVTNFGANGKDSKDDTAAFQKCIDRLSFIGGGTMYIPKGTYYISHLKFFGRQYSNITIQGNSSVIKQLLPEKRTQTKDGKWNTFAERKAADGIFVFDAQVSYQQNDNLSIKNTCIKNLTFSSDVAVNKFDELSHQISAHGVSNFIVENCSFIGFLGDGISINASTDYIKYRNAYNKDIKIINSHFDGINRDNRQAISIYYADNFLIDGCTFRNTTRSDMPGAIDIEPNDDLQVVRNGIIRNCSFENIGGLGAICFVLQKSTQKNAFSNKSFTIENCRFKKVVSPLTVIGNDDYIGYNGGNTITFSNSEVLDTQVAASLISAYGVKFWKIRYTNITSENLNVVPEKGATDVSFEDCYFNKVTNISGLGFVGNTSQISFLRCTFENFTANAITINSPSGISRITENRFLSTAYPGGKPIVTSFFSRKSRISAVVAHNESFGNFSPADLSVFRKQ